MLTRTLKAGVVALVLAIGLILVTPRAAAADPQDDWNTLCATLGYSGNESAVWFMWSRPDTFGDIYQTMYGEMVIASSYDPNFANMNSEQRYAWMVDWFGYQLAQICDFI
jgi:hypothetical protein